MWPGLAIKNYFNTLFTFDKPAQFTDFKSPLKNCQESNPVLLGESQKCYLYAMVPPPPDVQNFVKIS